MKFIKYIFILTLLILPIMPVFSYENPNNIKRSYLYIPKDTNNETMKILVLFYNYMAKNSGEDNSKEEIANWQKKAEQENFFIIGYDLTDYILNTKSSLQIINQKIEQEIELLQIKYTHKETKTYIVGSQYNGALAIAFHILFYTYNACISMNGNELLNFSRENIKLADCKTFYLFQGEKNRKFTNIRCVNTKNQLLKNNAIVKVFTYKNIDHNFPSVVYSDAIDKISETR